MHDQKLKCTLFLVLFTFFATPAFLTAQASLCGGSLGTNIFINGDFGSGPDSIYPVDPTLAPGFVYTTKTPPTDGTYTLTNDMTKWPNVWSTWLTIGDNSDDPNGYMMVVNASESPGIFYEQIIDDVCDYTLYEFSADAINIIRKNMGGHILPDISFYINDVLQYTTGPIEQDEKWHTYGFTFVTGAGQSSLKLTLRNNAPGGGGNDLAIDNISFRACGPDTDITLQGGGAYCEDALPVLTAEMDGDTGVVQWQVSIDSIAWDDVPGANSKVQQVENLPAGHYYFRFLYANALSNLSNTNCRIVSSPIRFEILPSYYTAKDTICEGVGYAFGDSMYYQPGFYQHTFTRKDQCDSIVTLELIHIADPIIITDYEIIPPSCKGAEDGTLRILDVTGIEGAYTFTLNDWLDVPANSTLSVPAGSYTAVVSDKYGCYDRQELVVADGPPLQISTIEDTSMLYGQRLQLTTFTNLAVDHVRWTPGFNLSCSTCPSTQLIVKDSTTYVVTATTAAGCEATDTVNVGMSHLPVRFVPNVFTPNNDQVNDVFEITIEPISFTSIDHIIVYDRWGNVMNQQSGIMLSEVIKIWDGNTAKGRASAGVYFYCIDYTLSDGVRKKIQGDVTVIN